MVLASANFSEVLIGGLLSGVLYSLVALGFVLIFKASGVFNFAQGAMVLLAGLALVRSLDYLAAARVPDLGGGGAGAAVRRRHHGASRPGWSSASCWARSSTRTA